MTKARWLAIVAIAGGVAYTAKGCLNRPDPDQKLAQQIEEMCEIARDGAEDPVAGLRTYGRYLLRNAGDIAKNAVDMIVVIERIRDEAAHTERAIIARDRLRAVGCPADWERFNLAIEANDEAKALRQEAADRLNHTLTIILKPGLQLGDLPAQLESLVTR